MTFQRAFEIVVTHEGGLSLDPNDRGNWRSGRIGVGELGGTRYGISAAAYPDLDIEKLSLDMARAIYERDYWKVCRCDEMPFAWALPVFDASVNQGASFARRTLQEALGVAVDGVIGPRTMAALRASGERQVAQFLARRALAYARTPGFERFGFGWLTRTYLIACEGARSLEG
jgi:lysozyme family protein